jgi:hypothetical protein
MRVGRASRHAVVSNGTHMVPGEFEQMGSASVQAMMISQAGNRLEGDDKCALERARLRRMPFLMARPTGHRRLNSLIFSAHRR